MAFRRQDDEDSPIDEPPAGEEDLLGDNDDAGDDEGEGDELFGANMLDDYRPQPELDRYDPTLLDDSEQAPMSVGQRRAAEEAMADRDRAERRQRRRLNEPGAGLIEAAPSSPGSATEAEPRSSRRGVSGFDTPRRGSSGYDPVTPGRETELGEDDNVEVDDKEYDLTDEILGQGTFLENRISDKIKLCFQQFLIKFVPEGAPEPGDATYPDLIRKMAEEDQRHLDVDYNHLQQFSPQLAFWVADSPVKVLPQLNQALMTETQRHFATYRDMEQTELRVAIHNFPVREKIRDLSTKHLNKLVSVTGVATKRSAVFNELKRLFLRCAKCNWLSGAYEVTEEKDLRPGSCIQCQSKGPWRLDRQKTLYRNFQKLTLQESPGSVEPGQMPRSKEVIITGSQVDTVRPGDEIYLTGVYKCLYDAATNARTCFPVYRTEIEAVHVHRKGDVKLMQLTDEVIAQIKDLASKPNIRERFIASIAPSIYGMKHVKTAIALSMMGGQQKVAAGKHRIRGDINTLVVGDPGLAKSQFLKYVEQTFPRAVYATGKGASAVGLTAAVMKDEHGEWGLHGGAMVSADNGICLIDEFDKMNDNDRTSLHEAMEQQTISISKAGIVATLQARCAIIAVANPSEGRYDPQRSFDQNVNLTGPILSRFDVLCVLRDESDAVQDGRLADHVICSHVRSHPEASPDDKRVQPRQAQQVSHVEPIPQELFKHYIVYARQNVHPKITDLDKDKLASFYRDIRAVAFESGGAQMTARHIDSIVRMAEANAKMELRSYVQSKDLDNAISTMLESFIQSQKHQVAEKLRHDFWRYIVQASPLADLFAELLEKLFRTKTEQIRYARPGMAEPDLAEVPVGMSDLVLQLQQKNLDVDEAQRFFHTQRFQQSYRLEGENIFRIV